MFSKRKKNYNIFLYTALIITICVLLSILLWPEPVAVEKTENEINVNGQANADDNLRNEEVKPNVETDIDKSQEDQSQLTETNTKSYYIVKKNDNVISVYFVTEDGTKFKLEDTDILYELLPPEDQSKFDTGIIIEDQEKLTTLLQDYES